ncbi:protein Shroom4 [Megalops cyprinoides]|uniref:protein Shroom4 n=1 Tax=Megalops cyprinoides TaxID=118141 RepID=UPI0018643C62|nr:protein Shroom4 [Megalops cyprinoides]
MDSTPVTKDASITEQRMETVEQLVSFHHIHVQLHGGAPWGFTLKGGLEHGEPLIITKIEDGGKAAQCKKLRVGDELVNINGSTLYGSRQEALILIKGSYRILKMVVRRRSVPVIRPHSWHLAKLSEPPGAATPDAPPAMQLHPVPFSVPWHSGGDNSDLSMQWSQLSRHCSTDRSSSLGSMESLDPPSQGYYESQLSPVDPAIFNNKRDSAYSSFSASSNTSDYTVSLRPDEASSMDNLLHGLGRYGDGRCPHSTNEAGDFPEEGAAKTQSLSRRSEARARPSSYSYEEERGAPPSGPPQPPARRDSFRATRGRPGAADKRCASAPVDILSLTSCAAEDAPKNAAGCPCESWGEAACKGSRLEQYYTLSSQLEPCRDCDRGLDPKEGAPSRRPPTPEGGSPTPSPPPTETSPGGGRSEDPPAHQLLPPTNKHQLGGHRHSAPEKLLSAQLRLLELSGSRADGTLSPCSQWSKSLLCPMEQPASPVPIDAPQGKWGGSRCSTPGSAAPSEMEDPQVEVDASGSAPGPSPVPHPWGRSVSVPGESAGADSTSESSILSRDFGGLSGSASMDTLLEEVREGGGRGGGEAPKPKPGSSRQHRSSKSRRRSERFATNLRNEIQRKKAQLQRSREGPGALLYGEETVEEEEAGEAVPEPQARLLSLPSQPDRARRYRAPSPSAAGPLNRLVSSSTPQLHVMAPSVPWRRDPDSARDHPQASQRPGPADPGRSDELSLAGKARRWRWTPELKLQPELDSEKRSGGIGGVTSAVQPGRAVTSVSRSSSRSDDCDIPPFADRRRFFEETIRSLSVSNLPSLTSRRQRPERHGVQPRPAQRDAPESAPEPGRRRFSYQGGVQPEISPHGPPEARRQSVSSSGRDRVSADPERDPERDFCRDRVHSPVVPKPQQRPLSDEASRTPSPNQCPYEHHNTHSPRSPRSAFHLVPSPASQDNHHSRLGYDHRSRTPTEAYPVREREQTKLNRKFSLTERDYGRCRRDLQPAEGDSRLPERLSVCSVEELQPPAQYPQRGRALSESDIRLDAQRLCTRMAAFTPPTLSELEETTAAPKKKGPPRPPPPNWEQFHRRRASHQGLLSASYHNLPSSASSSPPPRDGPSSQRSGLLYPNSTARPPFDPDATRPRSHSLPPAREEPESGPAFTLRAFRPVAPSPKEHSLPLQHPNPPRLKGTVMPPAEPCTRLTEPEADLVQDRPAALAPVSVTRRSTAEWDRGPASGSRRGSGVSAADVGGSSRLAPPSPQSYFSVNCEQQQQREQRFAPACPAPAPAPAPAGEELNGPFETDIDEFRDGVAEGPIAAETQCFAQPVTVLETDIDSLPEEQPPPPAVSRTPRGSVVEALLVEDSGVRSRADLMGELFPHSAEGEARGETWRGGHSLLEHSVDTLERRSRQGPPCTQGPGSGSSSYQSTSAAKSQLLNKMKELSEMNDKAEDEELSYKRQLMESLRKKLGVLREAQRGLQEDIRANAQLGEEVEALVLAVCKPNEVDKYRMFIGDLDKVVSLLLSLSGRLLRVESALDCLGSECSHHERLPLLEKKKLLQVQLGEAQELKEHVDRREQAVCRVLGRCLTPEQLRDYSHFVKMKAALLVEQRQLEDKIRLGEEQLRALRESLGLGVAVPVGLGYGRY